GMTELVVGGTLLIVLQDVIGLVNFLELLLGRRIARIAVRMILHGELAISLLDFIALRTSGHAQDIVIVLLRHELNSGIEGLGAPRLADQADLSFFSSSTSSKSASTTFPS